MPEVYIANLSEKSILSDTLCNDLPEGSKVDACTLDGMRFEGYRWFESSINNSNVNSVDFTRCNMDKMTFFRSNFEKTVFNRCSFINSTVFSGTALLKSAWNKCRINDMSVTSSTMQRVKMSGCIVSDSNFVDFEAVYADIDSCVFKNCRFEVTFEQGMNGFFGATLRNCIFVNCDFAGYPLRGAKVFNCVFTGNSGHVTDDIECRGTIGLGVYSFDEMQPAMKLENYSKARDFLESWS